MDSQDILARAYSLAGEYGVTRGAYARMDDGSEVTFSDPRATSFCTVGLVGRAALDLGFNLSDECKPYGLALLRIQEAIGVSPVGITAWNDNEATEADVKDALRRAAGLPAPQAEVLFTETPEAVLV